MRRIVSFTLIELLIVVAIIAILAAIAVPNFLEAQVRSKAARVKADLRSVATGLEAYRVDHNKYPDQDPLANDVSGAGWLHKVHGLTTPVAYLTAANMQDPFTPEHHFRIPIEQEQASYHYVLYNGYWNMGTPGGWGGWQLGWYPDVYVANSFGPDRVPDHIEFYPYAYDRMPSFQYNAHIVYPDSVYDATNGTRSEGDIGRCGGETNLPADFGG